MSIGPEGGTISNIHQGLTTTIQIPAGVLTQSTTFTFTSLTSPTQLLSSTFSFAGRAFTLEASPAFSGAITLTLHYDPAAGLEPDRLRIYYWDTSGPAWLDVATTCNPESTYGYGNHFVQLAICHLTEFALLEVGEGGSSNVYLPIILKQ